MLENVEFSSIVLLDKGVRDCCWCGEKCQMVVVGSKRLGFSEGCASNASAVGGFRHILVAGLVAAELRPVSVNASSFSPLTDFLILWD